MNSLNVKLSQSSAAMIPITKIKEVNAYEVELVGESLVARGMCVSERFGNSQ